MSITITGGISFSGGVGIVAPPAPPSTATAGWWGGGYNQTNVQRVTFATDTAASSTRGSLVYQAKLLSAAGTLTYGWWGGGQGSNFQSSIISAVQRVTFATDTATSSTRGPLSGQNRGLSATSDGTTYGWWGGGYNYPVGPGSISTVDRTTYATDTATTTTRGPLSYNVYYLSATGLSTSGWFAGGFNQSNVCRITYSSDTATASTRGPLAASRYGTAATTDSSTYGWFFGGSYNSSTIERITYATDTATASTRGPLASSAKYIAGAGDTSYGWVYGANQATTQRIIYATDTATATTRGPMTISTSQLGATGGTP